MLVKFAIEPDAIDDSMTRVDFERLLTVWGYGILVQPIKTITKSIAGLENQSKKRLFTALWERAVHDKGGCRRLSQNKAWEVLWDGITTSAELAQHEGKLDVAFLETTRAEELGLPVRQSKNFGSVEGVRLFDTYCSNKFMQVMLNHTFTVPKGKSRKELWSERCSPYAGSSQLIVIVDPYTFFPGNFEGFLFVLEFLEKDSNGCEVIVYSSYNRNSCGGDLGSIQDSLNKNLATFPFRRISNLEVRLFSQPVFSTYAHDRYIRFNQNVFHIGRGVIVFNDDRVRKATIVTLSNADASNYDYVETSLEKAKAKTLTFSAKEG